MVTGTILSAVARWPKVGNISMEINIIWPMMV